MNRWDLASQLRRRLSGEISEDELSAWAREKIMENDNIRPPLPIDEHDLLEDMLAQRSLAIEPGQVLTSDQIRAFVRKLTSP
jgi:hypothetical protein